MTRKHGIRPPRRPRKEDPYVTIGNQDKQIRLLIDRCCELESAYDEMAAKADLLDGLAKFANERADKIELVVTRMKGWQDCARELLP